MYSEWRKTIDAAWENRANINAQTEGDIRLAIDGVLGQLDDGTLRVVEKTGDSWHVYDWVKKGILLSFRMTDSVEMGNGAFDKVPLKFTGWQGDAFAASAIRAVPGSVVRRGAYAAPGVVLMPCFVNIGVHIGRNTMIDSWATVGSCAQIGAECHISSGVVIGGVLEPLQANPVIIEDHCFIGANSAVTEGVIVESGAVIAMGLQIGATTKIVDRDSGTVSYGRIPGGAVVVPGTMPSSGGVNLACAVIVKRVDAGTRAKTSINELLRD